MSKFSSLSKDGRFVAYGFGTISVRDLTTGQERILGPGFAPVWADARNCVASTDSSVIAYDVIAGTAPRVLTFPLKDMSGGGGSFCGAASGGRFVFPPSLTIPDCGVGAVHGASRGWIPGFGNTKPVVINGTQVHPGPAVELHTCDGVAWVWRSGGVTWVKDGSAAAQPVSSLKTFWPRSVRDGQNRLWVLEHNGADNSRLWLRRVDAPAVGILVSESGPTHYPDVVWSHSRGQFVVSFGGAFSVQTRFVSPSAPTVSLQPGTPVPVPTPNPPTPTEPVPVPEIPNSIHVVRAARAKYAHKSGPERAHLIVNQVAWDLRGEGAGLFHKTSGTQYNDRSIDIVIFQHRSGDPAGKGATFDILGDAEGVATPLWGRTQPTGLGDVSKWRAPVNPGDAPEPPEPPDPPPPTTDYKAALVAVRGDVAALLAKIEAALA